jgi:hypothetical protein
MAGAVQGALAIGDDRCANCHASLSGPFCAACGQACETHRRSLYRLVHGFIADLLHLESRTLRTIWALLARPGELSLAFHQGRTQRYVPPVRLYFFVSLLFFVALSFTHVALVQFNLSFHAYEPITPGGPPRVGVNPGLVFFQPVGSVASTTHSSPAEIETIRSQTDSRDSPFMRAGFTTLHRLQADPAALNGSLTEWLPRILFLMLPLFALVLALFHWGNRQYFFVDHLVFSLNLYSFGFAAFLVAGVLAQFVQGDAVGWLFFSATCTYLLVAMKRFYAQSWIRTGLKFGGVAFVYTMFVLLPASGGLIAASVYYG